MYKSFTKEEYKQYLGLPADYQVDGMLIAGTWKVDEEFGVIESCFKDIDDGVSISRINAEFIEVGKEATLNGKKYWLFVCYGGAMLSEFVHLACLFGSSKNILCGVAGGLAPEASTPDFILPTQAFKDGSSSVMYDAGSGLFVSSDSRLRESLKKRLGTEFQIFEGKTMTCQAMLAETSEQIQEWSKQGYIGVEMEAATVFAVSKHFSVPAAAVLSVADNLIKEETVHHQGYQDMADVRMHAKKLRYKAAISELIS